MTTTSQMSSRLDPPTLSIPATSRHSSYSPIPRALRAPFVRFALVGALNTTIDALALNLLIWLFDLRATAPILLANAVAYTLGAVNSFILNKRWTFGSRRPTAGDEVARFAATTLAGIALNDLLLWLIGAALLPALGPTALWATVSKLAAIAGSVSISYLGMRCWVFARRAPATARSRILASHPTPAREDGEPEPSQRARRVALSRILARHGLSVVLPAYNEEQAIGATLAEVVATLDQWGADFEVIVVDDGSADRTGALVAAYAERERRVRLISHPSNQGYGAALASGFAAATRDLTFFMDADGQFTIRDLALLLVCIEDYDAALGYRLRRQDTWMRLLNARGWGLLVRLALGVRVRDLDCAYKLLRTDFLRRYPPTTGSALVNAELVYALDRSGATYRQIGVRHLPRRGGRATGASPRVILQALWALATNAPRWRRRDYTPLRQTPAA